MPPILHLSEDPSLTTYFFLGVMGWGEGDIQMCDVVVVVVDGPLELSKIDIFLPNDTCAWTPNNINIL